MNKEQLKKILIPIKKLCESQHGLCIDCPLRGRHLICQYTRAAHLIATDTKDAYGNLYLAGLHKAIHDHCGEKTCATCPKRCSLSLYPGLWNLDKLP